jgi:hypothetical protein
MKATRDIGRALGFRRSGHTDRGPCTACGDPGFTAQDPDGRTLVTCHTGGSDQNDVRAALPEHGRWGSTAGYLTGHRAPQAALSTTRVATARQSDMLRSPCGKALRRPPLRRLIPQHTSDPAVWQRGLALVELRRCGVSSHNPNHSLSGASGNSDVAELHLQRNVVKLHSLGPHPLYELLLELGACTGTMPTIDQAVAHFAGLDPAIVHALSADRFPPRPNLRLVRGRDG